MKVVRIDHVYKDYQLGEQKVQALKDITLAFDPGVFLAIAGPSGSGKTTLLNLIGCIDTPSSGKIYINEKDVSGRTPNQLADLRARTIGFIFQTFNLLPVLSAAENVEYPLLHRRDMSVAERRERVALRLIACSFFGLAAFVSVDALRNLATGAVAQHSTVGIALACVSVVLMPLLSYAERRAGRELGSRSAVADSKQTLLCTYLSAVLLIGLVTNSAFGWWWADSLAALVIASVAVKEGVDAWRGDACCAPLPVTSEAAPCTEDCCR